jgi:class 3 adenylate cyclase
LAVDTADGVSWSRLDGAVSRDVWVEYVVEYFEQLEPVCWVWQERGEDMVEEKDLQPADA